MTDRAVRRLDIHSHDGVHPRHGVVDVMAFVHHLCPVETAARCADRFAARISIPVYRYGASDDGDPSLPELRRRLRDVRGHPTAGVVCVGTRGPLVAFNVNLRGSLAGASHIARSMRELPDVRALSFELRSRGLVQVSMNLIRPERTGPAAAFDRVRALAGASAVVDAEIVGLVPEAILEELRMIPLRAEARSIERALGI